MSPVQVMCTYNGLSVQLSLKVRQSFLDRSTLSAVRMGEESLRDKYIKALEDTHLRDQPSVTALLTKQLHQIESEIAGLPGG